MKKMFVWVTLIFLAIDLVTKTWAENTLMIGGKQETVISYLYWSLLYNKGMSFGFLESRPTLVLLLNFIAISVVIYILIKYLSHSFMWYIASALIIAGGIGNFVNRLFSGHVIDFISVQGYPAIFNVADIEIRLGMVFIIILVSKDYFVEKRKEKL
ncbi:signal peptidase II [Virgibacillus sp. DJP39]|uniref:signal peptidase II n=1 Tax=Virgibacillus sp. DJP39 TaxID=3409790 RepID=UPI003BB6444B